MSARFILTSRFPTKTDAAQALTKALEVSSDRRIFTSMDGDEVLELRALDDTTTLEDIDTMLIPEADRVAEYLTGDVRRELLRFIEAPKNCSTKLPNTPYVQLRHVEVKPEQMTAYYKWRDETIFDVVRGHNAAEVFLAYHSVVSGQPGVMFIAGFTTSPDEYNSAFTSDHYTEIVRQAGSTYITGGTEGLYTKIYQSPATRAA